MMIEPLIKEKIELLGINLLENYRENVCELTEMQHSLALSSGWHYLLDWVWVISNLGDVTEKTIFDAGGGIGLLQWYLAKQGANVVSVDRSNRRCIPFHLIKRFNVAGFTLKDKPLSITEMLNITNQEASLPVRFKALARGFVGELRSSNNPFRKTQGSVKLYNQDLRFLNDIPNNSMDMIVSISALEHNETIEDVHAIILELMRTLKPGGIMLITLPATDRADWFFHPAYSWCFSEETLRKLFEFPEQITSNFGKYTTIYQGLIKSTELKKHLAWRYFFGPNNGMPWGKWNPQYVPVGVLKVKSE
jgi:2-polyprenyl-3-methyl-5-hydroxy-6-metoxy-1,4-benzoquinol methylase